MPVTAPADRRFRRAHVKPARRRRVAAGAVAGAARSRRGGRALVGGGYGVAHGVANARALQVATIRVQGQSAPRAGRGAGAAGGPARPAHPAHRSRRVAAEAARVAVDRAGRAPARAALDGRSRDSRAAADGARAAGQHALSGGRRRTGDRRVRAELRAARSADPRRPRHERRATDGPSMEPARAGLAARVIASLGARPDVLQRVSQIDVTNPNDAVLMLDQDTAQVHVGERAVPRAPPGLSWPGERAARAGPGHRVRGPAFCRSRVRAAGWRARHVAASPRRAVNRR